MPKKLFFILYDVMLKYICVKQYMSQHILKYKYFLKIIEIIFNIYEICKYY
jgi:hypothetical protein